MPEASATTKTLEQQLKTLQEENRNLQERLRGGAAGDLDLEVFRLNEELRADLARQAKELDGLGDQNIDLAFQVEDMEGRLSEVSKRAAELEKSLEEAVAKAAEADKLRERLEASEAFAMKKADAVAAAEQEAGALRSERERLQREAQGLRGDLEEARAAVAGLTAERDQAREELRAAAEERDRLAPEAARAAEADAALAEAREALERAGKEAEDLRARLAAAEEKGREAETLAADLEKARAAEADLGQQVERLRADLASSAEEAAGLRLEADKVAALEERAGRAESDLAAAREEASALRSDLEAEQSARGPLEKDLAEARTRAQDLEQQLSRFKQQFLERAQSARASVEIPSQVQGNPREVLTALLGEALGSQGRRLVDRSFERCGAALDSRDPGELARVLEALAEAGGRLARTEEQKKALDAALADFRRALEDNAPAAAPALEQAPSPVAAEEAAAEAGSDLEEAPEPAALPAGEEDEEGPALRSAAGDSLKTRVEEGRKLLGLEKYEAAYDLFTGLLKEHPDVLEVQEGLFYSYVGFFSWREAHEIGRRLAPLMVGSPDFERFRATMAAVLRELHNTTRKMVEKKRLHLEMAELFLDEPQKALDQLRKARTFPDRLPEEARIDFYLLRFLAGTSEDRYPSLVAAMEGLADRLELFDHLEAILQDKRHAGKAQAGKVVLALVRESREQAREVRESVGAALPTVPATPEAFDAACEEQSGAILTFVLDQLLPRAGLVPRFPSPRFSDLVSRGGKADREWPPAGEALMAGSQCFPHWDLGVYRQPADGPSLVAASAGEPPVMALHPRLEEAPPEECRFLALRYLFALRRRQVHVWRASEVLDDAARCRLLGLTRDLIQEGGLDISDSIEREIDALEPADPALHGKLKDLLHRLYEHSLREEFRYLRELFFAPRPFAGVFDREGDRFAGRLVGPVAGSYAIGREALFDAPDLFDRVQKEGFKVLYRVQPDRYRALRRRLQRLWLAWL